LYFILRFKIKVASLVVRNKQSSLFCRSVKYEETKLYNIDTSLTFISATVVKIVDSLSEYFSGSNRRVSAKVLKKNINYWNYYFRTNRRSLWNVII
jgi:hypothetical protein